MTILFQTVLPLQKAALLDDYSIPDCVLPLQKAALLDDYSIPDCPSTAESSPLR